MHCGKSIYEVNETTKQLAKYKRIDDAENQLNNESMNSVNQSEYITSILVTSLNGCDLGSVKTLI